MSWNILRKRWKLLLFFLFARQCTMLLLWKQLQLFICLVNAIIYNGICPFLNNFWSYNSIDNIQQVLHPKLNWPVFTQNHIFNTFGIISGESLGINSLFVNVQCSVNCELTIRYDSRFCTVFYTMLNLDHRIATSGKIKKF